MEINGRSLRSWRTNHWNPLSSLSLESFLLSIFEITRYVCLLGNIHRSISDCLFSIEPACCHQQCQEWYIERTFYILLYFCGCNGIQGILYVTFVMQWQFTDWGVIGICHKVSRLQVWIPSPFLSLFVRLKKIVLDLKWDPWIEVYIYVGVYKMLWALVIGRYLLESSGTEAATGISQYKLYPAICLFLVIVGYCHHTTHDLPNLMNL